MKTIKLFSLLLLASSMAFFTNCNKEAEEDSLTQPTPTSPTSGAASFSCTIDGVAFTGVNVANSTITKFTAPTYAMDGKRLDIRATNAAGEMVILTMVDYRDGTAGNSFRTGMHYFNLEENPIAGRANGDDVRGVATFNQYSSAFTFINNSSGIGCSVGSGVNVTAIDASAKKVSGTFNGTLENIDGRMFTVTNGKFNNLPYVVM